MIAFKPFYFRYSIITVLKAGNIDHAVLIGLEIANLFPVHFTDGEYNIRQWRACFRISFDDFDSRKRFVAECHRCRHIGFDLDRFRRFVQNVALWRFRFPYDVPIRVKGGD